MQVLGVVNEQPKDGWEMLKGADGKVYYSKSGQLAFGKQVAQIAPSAIKSDCCLRYSPPQQVASGAPKIPDNEQRKATPCDNYVAEREIEK